MRLWRSASAESLRLSGARSFFFPSPEAEPQANYFLEALNGKPKAYRTGAAAKPLEIADETSALPARA